MKTSRSRRLEERGRQRASRARWRAFEIAERARLRAHFREVLAELAGRDTSELSPSQRARRALLIAELRRYAAAGRFPRNLDFSDRRMPYFVDAFGTRCAMAHLIETAGGAGLVARVAATANNAFVRELEGDLELAAWLDQAGLTAAEAARIQPSYQWCVETFAQQCVCRSPREAGPVTVVEAVVVAEIGDGLWTAVVTDVHGDTSKIAKCAEVEVEGQMFLGGRILKVLDGSRQFAVTEEGRVHTGCEESGAPDLYKKDAIAALIAQESGGSCAAYLHDVDPKWSGNECFTLVDPPGVSPKPVEDGSGFDLSQCREGGSGGGGSGGGGASAAGAGGETSGAGGLGGAGGAGGEGAIGGEGGGPVGHDASTEDTPASANCSAGPVSAGGLAPWVVAAGLLWARRRLVLRHAASRRH